MADEGEIHQHSGWLIPLIVAVVVVVLCAGLLLYYMRPFTLRTGTAPFRDDRASSVAIPVTMAGTTLSIPRRYIEPGASRGRNTVALVAALPGMRGFSEDDAQLFAGNTPDSPLVHLLIRAERTDLSGPERLQRVYMPYIANQAGEKGPFGLTHYEFRAGSGYSRDDLYAANGGNLLLLCEQSAQDLPSPNCLAIDRPIAPGLSLSYRFKRAQLSSWRAINDGVTQLVAGFRR
ncbi:MAG TPA: hypothetical protein VMU31_05925 [Rhizomicrobium sp.]|nr:hypothetical protein [Rhizomicrobium sp.]